MEKMKKLVLLNLPYLFIFILADRTSFLYQNSPGKVPGDKLLYLCTHSDRILGIVPSTQVKDLLIGLIVAVAAKLLDVGETAEQQEIPKGSGIWFSQMGRQGGNKTLYVRKSLDEYSSYSNGIYYYGKPTEESEVCQE